MTHEFHRLGKSLMPLGQPFDSFVYGQCLTPRLACPLVSSITGTAGTR
jgi:hypothetical protein